jgi:hypothetical protein
LKITGHFPNQTAQIFCRRKLVVGGIHADGFEDLSILNKAVTLESDLGKLSPVTVALFVVNLVHPPIVFPG